MIIGAATSDRQDRTSDKKSWKLREVSVFVAVFGREGEEKRAIVGVGRNNQRALRRDAAETAQCAPLIAPYGPTVLRSCDARQITIFFHTRGIHPVEKNLIKRCGNQSSRPGRLPVINPT